MSYIFQNIVLISPFIKLDVCSQLFVNIAIYLSFQVSLTGFQHLQGSLSGYFQLIEKLFQVLQLLQQLFSAFKRKKQLCQILVLLLAPFPLALGWSPSKLSCLLNLSIHSCLYSQMQPIPQAYQSPNAKLRIATDG